MKMISDKQEEMLAFIKTFVDQHGYPPTYEEIKTGLDISTKSLVNYHLTALEEANLLSRAPNTPRGIRLHADHPAATPALVQAPVADTVISPEDVLELTYNCITNESNLFAVKVEHETVAHTFANIGDIIILQQQAQTAPGEVVAVKTAEPPHLALKRYFRENGHVRLESMQPDQPAHIIQPDQLEIHGKVVAVIRQTVASA